MSDTTSSIILYVSAVIFTALMIVVIFNFKGTLVSAGASAQNDNERYITGEELERLDQMAGKDYTGSQLIDVIGECFDRKITVTVQKTNGSEEVYPYAGTSSYSDGHEVSRIINIAEAKKDIDNSSIYNGELVHDSDTGNVTGIKFSIRTK